LHGGWRLGDFRIAELPSSIYNSSFPIEGFFNTQVGCSSFIENVVIACHGDSGRIAKALKKLPLHWWMRSMPVVAVTPAQWMQSVMPVIPESPHIYKRHPYLPHKEHLAQLDWAFQALTAARHTPIRHGGVQLLASTIRIPVTTVRSWQRSLHQT
jgi:hypothetical protein